jgi:homoserine acetyltransferase
MDLFDMTQSNLLSLNLIEPVSLKLTKPEDRLSSLYHLNPPPAHLPDLAAGLSRLAETPILILGVQSDILFPVEQQRECADALRIAGNNQVVYYELGGVWGHDTFLLDVANVGGAIRGFLS